MDMLCVWCVVFRFYETHKKNLMPKNLRPIYIYVSGGTLIPPKNSNETKTVLLALEKMTPKKIEESFSRSNTIHIIYLIGFY